MRLTFLDVLETHFQDVVSRVPIWKVDSRSIVERVGSVIEEIDIGIESDDGLINTLNRQGLCVPRIVTVHELALLT